MKQFELWLEFEQTSPWEDLTNDFANIHVFMPDGRKYVLNVWTFKYLESANQTNVTEGRNGKGLYQISPDLFVKELTRECVEQTITELLEEGNLEDVLNDSIFDLEFKDPWWDAFEIKDHGQALEDQLHTEIGQGHPLFGRSFDFLAKRQDTDDVLIELEDKTLAMVHLTWSESTLQGGLPQTKIFKNKKDFWQKQLRQDILDYEN
ncbi:hypothetical protein [Fulvivirga sp.]|uniref:hypothetical protein n=1 Tax=Fulvivirga sp. TaxID=1931237 RepID=UPI0032EAE026